VLLFPAAHSGPKTMPRALAPPRQMTRTSEKKNNRLGSCDQKLFTRKAIKKGAVKPKKSVLIKEMDIRFVATRAGKITVEVLTKKRKIQQ
jgi:hypothetical protein